MKNPLAFVGIIAVVALISAGPVAAIVFGPEVTARTGIDTAWAVTIIDATRPCPIDGELTQWQLFAVQAGDIRLQAFRPVATGYQYLGENVVNVASGFNTIDIAGPNRLAVNAGDFIGFRYISLQEGMIGFETVQDFNVSITWPPNVSTDVAVGEVLPFGTFTGTSHINRDYSLAANVETSSVPEPAGFLALALGMFGAFRLRKR